MLETEAAWIGRTLTELPSNAFPLLNLGSSTAEFRERDQPWINESIFFPLNERGRGVLHADLKAAEGVDVVADLTSASDREILSKKNYSTVLCSNVMEHLPFEPIDAARMISSIVPSSGRLVLTVPRRYGYHPDPIDNGFRPTVNELAAMFEDFHLHSSETVYGRRGAYYLSGRGTHWGRYIIRMALPIYRPRTWWRLVRESPRKTAATCCVLIRG